VVVRGGCGSNRHRWDSLAEDILIWRMEDMGVLQPSPIFYVNFRISSVIYPIYTFSLTIAFYQGPGGPVYCSKLTCLQKCNCVEIMEFGMTLFCTVFCLRNLIISEVFLDTGNPDFVKISTNMNVM
jgi:hypothetical protein